MDDRLFRIERPEQEASGPDLQTVPVACATNTNEAQD
jgi:hypothetical protein